MKEVTSSVSGKFTDLSKQDQNHLNEGRTMKGKRKMKQNPSLSEVNLIELLQCLLN